MDVGTRGKLQVDESEVGTSFKRQGSLRKVLPPFTSVNEVGVTSIVTSSAVKMIDRPPSSVSENKNDGIFGGNGRCTPGGIEHLVSQEYMMINEYQLVLKQAIPGMYLIPSANSAFMWFGVYFIHEGFYEGGVFRFQLRIPSTFPNSGPPEVIFETPIFHPMVDPQTGVIAYKDALEAVESDEKKEFPDRPSFSTNDQNHHSRHIWPILLAIQLALIKPETSNPLNTEAAEIHRNNAELFAQKAAESAKRSMEHLNDPTAINDPHYFVFKEYDEQVHEQYRKQLLNQLPLDNSNSSSSTIGLSWVQPGTLIPFSKKLSFL